MDKKVIEDEPQVALAKQIIAKVGDMASVSSLDELSSNISQLATILVDVGDLKVFPDDISNIFVRCMSSLPVQSTVISTVLALVFRKDGSFPIIVVEKLEALLIHSMEINDIMASKIILRSMASMTACNALDSESFFASLSVLHDRVLSAWPASKAEDFPKEAAPLLYLLASTIPWTVFQIDGGDAILMKCKQLFERFLDGYSSPFNLKGQNAVFQAYACPLDEQGNETTHEALGALHAQGPEGAACWDTLWESVHLALNLMTATKLEIPTTLLRPWTHEILVHGLAEEVSGDLWDGSPRMAHISLSEGFGHALREVAIGSSAASSSGASKCQEGAWLTPIFSLFDASTSPAAAACSSSLNFFERCTLSNYFRDITHFFDPVINEDGTYTGSMQLLMSHLWAVGKHGSNMNTEALSTLLIETLLHKLVHIPRNNVHLSSVTRLLLELCKSGGQIHIQALGQGVHLLFNMIDEMDYRAYASLADWFAMHLVNTQLTWPYWSQWVNSVKEDNNGAFVGKRAFFCNLVIDKLSRQALPQNVQPTLMGMGELIDFVQREGGDDVVIKLDGIDEGLVQELRGKIDLRVEDEEVFEFLEEKEGASNGVVLLQVLLAISGNVPSSFITLINRYGETLRTLSAGKLGEAQLTHSLWSSTSHDGGLFLQYLDICLRRGVITCRAATDLLTSEALLDTIDSNIWTARLIFEVAERALDIASTALASYSGDPTQVKVPLWNTDDNVDEEDADDDLLTVKTALSSVRFVHVQFLTSLLGSGKGDIVTSCISKLSYIFKCREISVGANVELTDRSVVWNFLKKDHKLATSDAAQAFY